MAWPKPPHFSFGEPFPAEAGPGLQESRSSRSSGGSPGSGLGPKPLPFTVRFPASGRGLGGSPVRKLRAGRSRSVFSGRQECQPKLAPFPVGSPSKPKPWRLASEARCRPKPIRFSGFGSPSEPKLFRFSFGGPVKPKLLVPPGCSTKLADLAKAKGQARCVRMAAASSAALALTFRIFACGPIRSRFRPQPGHSSRGAIDPATTGTCHGKPSRQSRICLWITRITGVESAPHRQGDCVDRPTLLWASAFLSRKDPRRKPERPPPRRRRWASGACGARAPRIKGAPIRTSP